MEKKDVWASGEKYEPYVGRWSRLVAKEFLEWVNAPVGIRWLDVGSGSGALSSDHSHVVRSQQSKGR
ncbi:MAG: hypothetical protein QM730_08075 [Anaerolineales bacterium]